MFSKKIFLALFLAAGVVPLQADECCETVVEECTLTPFVSQRFMLGLRGGLIAGPFASNGNMVVERNLELEMSLRLYDKLWFWIGDFRVRGFEAGLKYYIPFTEKTAFYVGAGASSWIECYCCGAFPLVALRAGLQHYFTDNIYLDVFSAGNVTVGGGLFRCGLGIGVSF